MKARSLAIKRRNLHGAGICTPRGRLDFGPAWARLEAFTYRCLVPRSGNAVLMAQLAPAERKVVLGEERVRLIERVERMVRQGVQKRVIAQDLRIDERKVYRLLAEGRRLQESRGLV